MIIGRILGFIGAKGTQKTGEVVPEPGPPAIMFRLTCYHPVREDEPESWKDWRFVSGTETIDVRGLGRVEFPAHFVAALRGEGVGRTKHGIIGFAPGFGYTLLDAGKFPWGVGAKNNPLVPFRSVAVDRSIIPLGATVYTDALRGYALPDGTSHDGVLSADDTGGRIVGHHIDLFVPSVKDKYGIMQRIPSQVGIRWT